MHLGHDHDEGFGGGPRAKNGHHRHGHNQPPGRAVQWQTPHLPHDHAHPDDEPHEHDLDLVEAAFVEAFSAASDVTSFLRVAGVPFVGEAPDGRQLHLLRVETETMVDVGSVAPLIGGGAMRYDPLPAKMASRRRRLAFLYHDGNAIQRLDFAAVRALADRSGAASFETSAG
jgi:hypothetical protein